MVVATLGRNPEKFRCGHACSQCCDHSGVADLTDVAVREMRLFLAGVREDVMRWLPPPQWEPSWRSEAAREIGNSEAGPAGAWGEDTVRTVYAGAALYLDTILRSVIMLLIDRFPRSGPGCRGWVFHGDREETRCHDGSQRWSGPGAR